MHAAPNNQVRNQRFHQRTATAFLRNPVSDKLGKIPSYGIVVAKVRSAQRLHMRP
jgi:hypothetical protein